MFDYNGVRSRRNRRQAGMQGGYNTGARAVIVSPRLTRWLLID